MQGRPTSHTLDCSKHSLEEIFLVISRMSGSGEVIRRREAGQAGQGPPPISCPVNHCLLLKCHMQS